jgi:hypothetical protein
LTNKKLAYISSVAILLLCILFFPGRKNYERVHYGKSFKRFDEAAFADRIKDTKDFYKDFAYEYVKILNDSFPNFSLLDSLPVGDPTKAKLTLYLSASEETMLKLDKGYPELTIEATNYPVQLALGFGLDFTYDNRELPYDPSILDYFGTSCVLQTHRDTPVYYINTNIHDYVTNIFCLYPNALIITSELSYGGQLPNMPPGNFNAPGYAFWTSINGFDHQKHQAKEAAKKVVFSDLRDMFLKSDFFQNALKNQILSPLARIIADKSKDEQDGIRIYEQTEYFKDQQELINKAKLFGLESAYALELIQYAKERFFSGRLFFKYYSQVGFMVQWALANFLFLWVAFILKMKRQMTYVLFTIKTFRLSPFGGIVLFVNGYILNKQPNSFVLTYAMLPVILFGMVVFVTLFDLKRKTVDWGRF